MLRNCVHTTHNANGRITRKNLIHHPKNPKTEEMLKIFKNLKNPKILSNLKL